MCAYAANVVPCAPSINSVAEHHAIARSTLRQPSLNGRDDCFGRLSWCSVQLIETCYSPSHHHPCQPTHSTRPISADRQPLELAAEAISQLLPWSWAPSGCSPSFFGIFTPGCWLCCTPAFMSDFSGALNCGLPCRSDSTSNSPCFNARRNAQAKAKFSFAAHSSHRDSAAGGARSFVAGAVP